MRTGDVDGRYFGLMLAAQPELPVGPGLAFVTDIAAGFYLAKADGDFTNNGGGPVSISDSRSTIGFRGRLGGALKQRFAPGIVGSLFAGLDYWSDFAKPFLPGANPNPPAGVAFDGLVEVKAGARLTFATGSAN